MVDEFRVEEQIIDAAIERASPGGVCEDRLIYHILTSIREMGYRWRSEYKVVLFRGDIEAEFDEDYGKYLDKKAQREEAEFTQSEIPPVKEYEDRL